MERRTCTRTNKYKVDMDTIVSFVIPSEQVSVGGAISLWHHVNYAVGLNQTKHFFVAILIESKSYFDSGEREHR